MRTLIAKRNRELEQACTRPGYYLVKDGARYFVSTTVSELELNKVANRVLSDRAGWGYWVDYLHGPDVHGKPHWSNVDHTDRFI